MNKLQAGNYPAFLCHLGFSGCSFDCLCPADYFEIEKIDSRLEELEEKTETEKISKE